MSKRHPETESPPPEFSPFRSRLHEIILEADTPAGKAFDVVLLWAILLSVLAVLLESVAAYRATYGPWLRGAEWVFTFLFTLEYVLRLYCVHRPARYARSFFGVVDLAAIIPTYLSLVITGTQSLIVIRALRLLRVFRVLNQDFHFGPGTVTGYTPAAPNTTSFRAEPCTSPPPVGARARPSAHRR